MRERLQPTFFFAVLLFLFYWGCRMFQPFAGPLVCAIAVAVVFYPMHSQIALRIPKKRAWLAALLSDFIVFLFFVVPTVLLVWSIVSELDNMMPTIHDWFNRIVTWIRSNPTQHSSWLSHLPSAVTRQLDLRSAEVQDRIAGMGNRSLQIAAGLAGALAGHTFSALFDTVIFLFVLYFLFLDGPSLFRRLTGLMPLENRNKERISEKVHMTVLGVVRGTFLTALVQGASATIGFLIARVPAALVLGFLTALATFIPSIGTTLVWVPVSLFYLVTGSAGKAIFIAVWGILVVGLVDNLLRPYIVGNKAEMPFLWLFFALLGGIEVFGLLGVILGPLIFGMIAVFLEIYEKKYLPES